MCGSKSFSTDAPNSQCRPSEESGEGVFKKVSTNSLGREEQFIHVREKENYSTNLSEGQLPDVTSVGSLTSQGTGGEECAPLVVLVEERPHTPSTGVGSLAHRGTGVEDCVPLVELVKERPHAPKRHCSMPTPLRDVPSEEIGVSLSCRSNNNVDVASNTASDDDGECSDFLTDLLHP